jgi:hypothetical protein
MRFEQRARRPLLLIAPLFDRNAERLEGRLVESRKMDDDESSGCR